METARRRRDEVPQYLDWMSDLNSILRLMADDPTHTEPRPVRERLAQLVDALEAAGASYAVCGAVAMGAHGVRRFTEDIDVLVARRDLGGALAELGTAFIELGREPAGAEPALVRLRANGAPGPDWVDVDVLVPVDALEQWSLDTAIEGSAFGRRVRLVTPEALVVMKLRAYSSQKDSLEAAGHHYRDAARLLREVEVDVEGLREFLADHELLGELERALAQPPPRRRR